MRLSRIQFLRTGRYAERDRVIADMARACYDFFLFVDIGASAAGDTLAAPPGIAEPEANDKETKRRKIS